MPRTGVTGDCELPFKCWEQNLSPLQEQYIPELSLAQELSFKSSHIETYFRYYIIDLFKIYNWAREIGQRVFAAKPDYLSSIINSMFTTHMRDPIP